jgi:hypothetical protein
MVEEQVTMKDLGGKEDQVANEDEMMKKDHMMKENEMMKEDEIMKENEVTLEDQATDKDEMMKEDGIMKKNGITIQNEVALEDQATEKDEMMKDDQVDMPTPVTPRKGPILESTRKVVAEERFRRTSSRIASAERKHLFDNVTIPASPDFGSPPEHAWFCCGRKIPDGDKYGIKLAAFGYFLKSGSPVATSRRATSGVCKCLPILHFLITIYRVLPFSPGLIQIKQLLTFCLQPSLSVHSTTSPHEHEKRRERRIRRKTRVLHVCARRWLQNGQERVR